ncbi:protein SNORC-like [Paramormyrops kingsleyae]|uniref:protein SNORC-like n=1 Tax=Paramormyrops kingsleyae TaxID=1676925 RepID=UPI003B96C103
MDAVTLPGLFLAVLALCANATRSEAMADPSPQADNPEMSSGGGAYDITTRNPFQELTRKALTSEYEDLTHSQPLDDDYGVLGPGAISVIVIAVFLGTSALLALTVISLRKLAAS